jgi:tRNA nucleotidyltransferase (CCA-adding enzyme)
MGIIVDQQVLANAIPASVRDLCRRIHEAGFGVWCVGGAIRDVILAQLRGLHGTTYGDWDIASTATPVQVTGLFRRVIPSGIRHGTVTVLLPDQAVEVTTLRGEQGYADGRHPDRVVFFDDIARDLARRDFTINAIAYDPIGDRLVDPFRGIDDIEARCLRAVGDPLERFSEDGLRVLRAARFAATLEVQIESKTKAAIRPSLNSYRRVSAERIRDEWTKALGAPQPSRAFRIMQDHGMLAISAPELAQTHDCTQNRHHHYDVWEHTILTVDRVVPSSLVLRLAALMHDVGKPAARTIDPKHGDYTFHGHEILGAQIADIVLRRLRFANDLREVVVTLVRHHIVAYDTDWTDAAVRRWLNRVGSASVSNILELATADVIAKGHDAQLQLRNLAELEQRVRSILGANQAFTLKDLAVTGTLLMEELDLAPGPVVGQVLRALLDDVLEAPEHNERERLLDRARELLKSP